MRTQEIAYRYQVVVLLDTCINFDFVLVERKKKEEKDMNSKQLTPETFVSPPQGMFIL